MIVIQNLVKTYNKGKENELQVLKGLNLTVEKGELVAIVGKSGAGKTTLLHIIGCIEKFEEGSYQLNGTEVSGLGDNALSDIRNQKIGIVKQDFALIQEYSVLENVLMPLYISGVRGKARRQKAMEALQRVKMDDMADKQVRKLSGGQKQRVAIARAIVNEPDFILADEPTGALDTVTAGQIMELFTALNQAGKTVIIVTHDRQIAESCKRIITISDGVIV